MASWPQFAAQPPCVVKGAQGMHAFSFSAVFLATQRMLAETVPEARIGAAQGAAYFANNTLLAILTLAAGPLYRSFGPGSFATMAGISAVGFILAIACVRLAPERRLRRLDNGTVIDEAG